MANSLGGTLGSGTGSFARYWAKSQQEVFLKRNLASQIADMSFNSTMGSGDTLQRVYRSTTSDDVMGAYTRGTDLGYDDITDVGETLIVNRQFAYLFYLDNFDKIQDNYNAAMDYGRDKGVGLMNQVDADVLGEWVNAASVVDDGTLGGTAGNGIAISALGANIPSILTAVGRKLEKLNVMSLERFGVVSPEFKEACIQYFGNKVTVLGDDVSVRGMFNEILGFKLYSSNLTPARATLALATIPTAAQTVTIDGMVFTAVSTIGTTAGNVLFTSADDFRANLAASLTLGAGSGTLYVPYATTSNTGRKIANRIVSATNDNAADTLVVTMKGVGTMVVSTTVTDAVWTTTSQKQLLCFGVKGNPVLVMQDNQSAMAVQNPTRLGKNIMGGVLYGVKTFADNAKQMVRVEIKSSTY